MKHNIKVIGITNEIGNEELDIKEFNKNAYTFSGKAAGICYMPDDYLSDGIQNSDNAIKRANGNVKSGHHSVFDHLHINMIINTDKMMAMILNSLGVYTTSEKSARYTKMKPETDLELEMYEKWIGKIQQLILKKYPYIDDDILSARLCKKMGIDKCKAVINGSCSHIKDDEFLENELNELKRDKTIPSYKLAQENARYMISVFTPTTMEYTISYRQLMLAADYLKKLHINCKYILDNLGKFYKNKEEKVQDFITKLDNSVVGLQKAFDELIDKDYKIKDIKNQYIRFLEGQHFVDVYDTDKDDYVTIINTNSEKKKILSVKINIFGDCYTTSYAGSLAMLAQAQRHRTLRYSMLLEYPGQFGFYVPPIIEEFNISAEWLTDIHKVAYCVPQGTIVRITEQGLFEDFALKCKERMCGRAQLEITRQTSKTVNNFIDNYDELSYSNQLLLDSITCGDDSTGYVEPCARCKFPDFTCREGCTWGPKEALTRLI